MSSDKLVIGLTGGIGSGKSAAATLFEQLGVTIVDADIASRKVVEPGSYALQQLVEHYGSDILTPETPSELDRQKLRNIIFSNPDERQWLNNLLHPLIRDYMNEEVANAQSHYVIKVIPLLVESKLQQQVDRVLVIDVPEETQIQRVTYRDMVSISDTKKILKSQASREQRLIASDDIIINDTTIENLEVAVKKMHNTYLQLSIAKRTI
ncbi:MAG: dephospho-CoA kinase [Gammaproteobacteria bacterium]|nr:dephospho-CoA kinase [Gammaproteobacteria bacterium]